MYPRKYNGHVVVSQKGVTPFERPFAPSYIPSFKDPEKFIDDKIKMLQDHFKIELSKEDIEWLREFKTEGEINAAVRKLIDRAWEE